MKNRVFHIVGFLLLTLVAANVLTACGSAKTRIERVVGREFQEKMRTFPFNTFDIVVQQVKLIKTGRRHYDGEVVILVNDVQSRIGINVRAERRTIIWKEKDYMDYLPALGSGILDVLMGPFNTP